MYAFVLAIFPVGLRFGKSSIEYPDVQVSDTTKLNNHPSAWLQKINK